MTGATITLPGLFARAVKLIATGALKPMLAASYPLRDHVCHIAVSGSASGLLLNLNPADVSEFLATSDRPLLNRRMKPHRLHLKPCQLGHMPRPLM